jgi:long-subunit fatty acid transport protein
VDVPVDLDVQIPTHVREFVARNLPTVMLPPIEGAATIKTYSPMMVAASLQVAPSSRLSLNLDFQWVDKSRMSTFAGIIHRTPETSELITDQVVFNPFKDFFSFGLRGLYQLIPAKLACTLGLAFEPNTRLDNFASPMLMDMHKLILRVGVSWRPTRWVTLVLDYGRFFVIPRTIGPNLYQPNASPTTPEEEALDRPSPTGRYWAEADRAGIGILLHF